MAWDYIIVGSGFGGSVSALRLVEKGYRVLLLEQGRRYRPSDFPRTNWNLRRWLWAPRLGLRGPFRMTFLRHVTALSGVGVGGGSLVYAGVLSTPRDAFFDAPAWRDLADWRRDLAPHYETARRMLGAARFPDETEPDRLLAAVARDLGASADHGPTEVGVYFGTPGAAARDPYFGGAGPDRAGCTRCGGCMVGCRHGAKNTLDRNYLWLAERRGLEIRDRTRVTAVRPAEGGWEVEAVSGAWPRRRRTTFRAGRVVLAGGVLGTVPLLLRMRDRGVLSRLSPRLGDFVRTNSEVLMGVVTPRGEMSEGVAITSMLRTSDRATLQAVRYPSGSGALRVLQAPHGPGGTLAARLVASIRRAARRPLRTLGAYAVRDWARRTMILLYMSTDDGHLRLRLRRGGGLTTDVSGGRAPSASIAEATELGERLAEKSDGYVVSFIIETLRGTPTTAHILGGCAMGVSPEAGVIGPDHQVWGHPGLFVVDGSALPANPGVNPSLTICALAERAMAGIPDASPQYAFSASTTQSM